MNRWLIRLIEKWISRWYNLKDYTVIDENAVSLNDYTLKWFSMTINYCSQNAHKTRNAPIQSRVSFIISSSCRSFIDMSNDCNNPKRPAVYFWRFHELPANIIALKTFRGWSTVLYNCLFQWAWVFADQIKTILCMLWLSHCSFLY